MATKIGWTPPPPRRDYHTGITGAPERTGVHVRHCCQVHGCKYGYDDCPVVDCTAQQSGPCEDCFNDIEVWQAGYVMAPAPILEADFEPLRPPKPVNEVPWVLGPALVTGRKELVRLCASGQAFTPEDVRHILDFAEGVAVEIEKERQTYALLETTIVEQTRSVNGVVGVLWRISDALRKARNGSDPSAVADAIKNPRTANKKVTDDNLEG